MKRLLILLVLFAACHDATAPKKGSGVDPTVLITNEMTADSIFFTWRDGQGVAGGDTILPNHTACEKFTARPDSAYFDAFTPYHTTDYTAPWFDPTARDGFTISWTYAGGPVAAETSPNLPC